MRPLSVGTLGAVPHKTARPYSPVIEIDARRLVVVSGQVAVDLDGVAIGETIEEQTRATLENCARQLATGGVDLADVFKVNIYLSDPTEWARFNADYDFRLRFQYALLSKRCSCRDVA